MKKSPLQRRTPLKRRAKPRPERPPLIDALIAQAEIMEKYGALQRPKPKPRKPLPKVSAKGKARNAEYAKAKAEFWATHDGQCEFRFWLQSKWHDAGPAPYGYDEPSTERCSAKATELHHRALRGRNLCNIATFCGLCADHHCWTHQHANEARRLRYLIPAKQP